MFGKLSLADHIVFSILSAHPQRLEAKRLNPELRQRRELRALRTAIRALILCGRFNKMPGT